MTRCNKFMALLFLLLTLVSCGDLFKNKKVTQELDSSQFAVNCVLDVDEFSKILTKTIPSQIRCLGENLNLFIRMVETDKPGYMSRNALVSYIKKNRKDIKPEIINALKAVYDLNYLLTGDSREYISKKNVDSLIDFAVLFNSEMALNIHPYFTSKDDLPYAFHETQRKWVSTSSKKIINALRGIFRSGNGAVDRELDIEQLLMSFKKTIKDEDIKKITSALFIKKVLFGGKSTIVTSHELNERVLLNFDQILLSVFDIVKFKYIETFTQEQIFDLLQRNLKSLSELVMDTSFGNRDGELYFTIDEVMTVADLFIDDKDFDSADWMELVHIVKEVYMGGVKGEVRGLDFKKLLAHGNNILKTGSTFYRIWKRFVPAMESPLPVTVNFSEYVHVYPEEAEELAAFERIAKNYRFFRGKFEAPYFTKGIKRNADGMVEVYMIEYLITKIIQTYGTKNDKSIGGKGIDRDQLLGVISRIEPVLLKMKLSTPHRKTNLADNISLLGTLFQYQSDTNGLLDANEATEFALTLLTAMDMSDTLMDYFKTKPECTFDKTEDGRVDAACFKKYFYNGICEAFDDGNKEKYRDGYRAFFPHLFESLGVKSCEEMKNTEASDGLLDVSIGAARLCSYYDNADGSQGEEIPFSNGDIFTTLVVFMHAETTILRWDDVNKTGNGNNFMDPKEVDRAYEIYAPALDGFLKDKPSYIKALKKQIYQFLIKEETVPDETSAASIDKFKSFLLSFKWQAPAYRRSLSAVLSEIGKQTGKMSEAAGAPKFQCNWLKDPDNIPMVLPPAPPVKEPPKKSLWENLKFILDIIF